MTKAKAKPRKRTTLDEHRTVTDQVIQSASDKLVLIGADLIVVQNMMSRMASSMSSGFSAAVAALCEVEDVVRKNVPHDKDGEQTWRLSEDMTPAEHDTIVVSSMRALTALRESGIAADEG